MQTTEAPTQVRRTASFGSFELDLATGELRKDGMQVKLRDQSLSILRLLLERNGEVVTREEFRRHLWPGASYLEFDTGLNSAIRRVRTVLGDTADNPRFIQTVSRHGYRFIAPVRFAERKTQQAPQPAVEGETANIVREGPKVQPHWKIWSIACAGALLGIAGAMSYSRATVPAKPPLLVFKQLTFQRGAITGAGFSADQHTIVYSSRTDGSRSQIFLSRDDHPEALPLGVDGDVLAVSRNNDIALAVGRRSRFSPFTVAVVSMNGGKPREVIDGATSADWMPDGSTLAVVRSVGGKQTLEFPSGTQVFVSQGWISDLKVSPRGDQVAFFEHPRLDKDSGRLMTVNATGRLRILTEMYGSANGIAWSSDGSQIWFTAGSYSNERDVNVVNSGGGTPILAEQFPESVIVRDAAPDGRLLVLAQQRRISIYSRRLNSSEEQDLSLFDGSRARCLSRDGKFLVFEEVGQAAGRSPVIYLRDIAAGHSIRLGEGSALAISPDNKWVLTRDVNAASSLFLLPTGVGKRRDLPANGVTPLWAAWHPDGSHVIYAGAVNGGPVRVYWQSAEGGPPTAISNPISRQRGALSSDGHYLAAVRDDGTLVSISIPGGEEKVIGKLDNVVIIGWSSDGKSLFVHDWDLTPLEIQRLDIATGRPQPWQRLAPRDTTGLVTIDPVLVSSDASQIIYTCTRIPSDVFVASPQR